MSVPIYTAQEEKAHEVFESMMWAMSHPGRAYNLPEVAYGFPNNFEAISLTLLDLEATFYTPTQSLIESFERTTARFVEINKSEYLFFEELDEYSLNILEQANVGSYMYPDHGATIFVKTSLEQGITIQCSGPGIKTTQSFQVDGIPIAFLELRNRKRNYPLGWDIFFVSDTQIIGLPRTTIIEWQ